MHTPNQPDEKLTSASEVIMWTIVTNVQLVLWQEFAPSDEELEAYRKGEEWDPKLAEQRRRLKVRLDSLQ